MILYAILETNTNLYVTRMNSLEELGKYTRLFNSVDEAKRAMNHPTDYETEFFNPIRNSITWYFLEKKHGIDRWHLDISWREFREMDKEVNLKIVKVQLNERKAKEKRVE